MRGIFKSKAKGKAHKSKCKTGLWTTLDFVEANP